MKRIDLINPTIAQMEAWIRSELGEDPRVLFAVELHDRPIYESALEHLISNAIADHIESGRELDDDAT